MLPPEEKLMPVTARRLIDAFLAGDTPSAAALLTPDARFHSPIRDYVGADQIGSVWHAVAGVVQNARPTSIHERDCETIAFFAGTIKDRAVDGVVRTLTNESNRVSDITLMVRPWAALKAGLADIKL
jgi:SnoaL-like domain